MFSRIANLEEKLLIGKSHSMSLIEDKTFELWQGFMQNRKLITNAIGTNLYSIQTYPSLLDYKTFTPHSLFVKSAAIEVKNHHFVPNEMKAITIPKGTYAIFIHKGPVNDFPLTMNYIFKEWLPSSDYELDNRPHFEILGEKYKNNDPLSEEEVWIPIQKR